MSHGDLVVVFQASVPKLFEYFANTDHAKLFKPSRPERRHASATEYVDPLIHRPKNLLVPDGGYMLKIPVNDSNSLRSFAGHSVHIAFGHGREVNGIEFSTCLFERNSRTYKDACIHALPSITARARRPRIESEQRPKGSSRGITTRATGIRNSGFVRSTTMARSTPLEHNLSSSHATSDSKVSLAYVGIFLKLRIGARISILALTLALMSGLRECWKSIRNMSSREPKI